MNIESLIESYSKAITAIDTNDYQKQVDKIKSHYDASDFVVKIGSGTSLGALAGGTAGSFVPVIGTAIGAGLGGVAGTVLGGVGAVGSLVFDAHDASSDRKEVQEQVTKMKANCSTLASMIAGNTNHKIADAIIKLENSKKLMSKQTIKSSNGKNQSKEILSSINKELASLKKIQELNSKFISRLQELGKGEKIGPAK